MHLLSTPWKRAHRISSPSIIQSIACVNATHFWWWWVTDSMRSQALQGGMCIQPLQNRRVCIQAWGTRCTWVILNWISCLTFCKRDCLPFSCLTPLRSLFLFYLILFIVRTKVSFKVTPLHMPTVFLNNRRHFKVEFSRVLFGHDRRATVAKQRVCFSLEASFFSEKSSRFDSNVQKKTTIAWFHWSSSGHQSNFELNVQNSLVVSSGRTSRHKRPLTLNMRISVFWPQSTSCF